MNKTMIAEESISDRARRYAGKHAEACENWPHGEIADFWEERDGNLCIQYKDGSWFHYKEAGEMPDWW